VNQLPGIVKFSYDEGKKEATVVFDSSQVDREAVSAAITKANADMSDDDDDAEDASKVLGDS
jgi:copper chaperone CopZ|tara:strand:- start:175 stop:360 length:186 start_codon:yes stop_codon:yes gene_type:complete